MNPSKFRFVWLLHFMTSAGFTVHLFGSSFVLFTCSRGTDWHDGECSHRISFSVYSCMVSGFSSVFIRE
uniref:Uncharacterized protein n=1 Tax=Anguilla anguilla TaxID=7936 RepID=A0A0E9WKA5_ANGAN